MALTLGALGIIEDGAEGDNWHPECNALFRALTFFLGGTSVIDKDLATPPGSPAHGAAYIIAASPTGAWSGHAGKLARWSTYGTPAWDIYPVREGMLAWVEDENLVYRHDGSSWALLSIAATPSGPAGGSLTGTYPNPTIASDVALPGNPTTTTQATGNNTTRVATTAFVQQELDPVADTVVDHEDRLGVLEAFVPAPIDAETGSFTLALADNGMFKTVTNASPVNVTVPPQGSVPWTDFAEMHFTQGGAGQVTFVAGSGVTIRVSATFTLAMAGQWAVATLKRLASNEWLLFGDLEPA